MIPTLEPGIALALAHRTRRAYEHARAAGHPRPLHAAAGRYGIPLNSARAHLAATAAQRQED